MSVMVYKVLYQVGDELWSGSTLQKGVAVKYSRDEVNYPSIPASYLFAFATRGSALYWLHCLGFPFSHVIYYRPQAHARHGVFVELRRGESFLGIARRG